MARGVIDVASFGFGFASFCRWMFFAGELCDGEFGG
jgi:hypothetical protein